jgi:uncharacterized membrane protein (UPF0127 family)
MASIVRRTALLALFASLALSGCAAAEQKPVGPPLEPLEIATKAGVKRFQVEIADTAPERERGLMFRKSMPEDHGMLFEFEDSAPRAFWMHNTYLPLDIIYIDTAGTIVSISHNAVPFDDTPIPSVGAAQGVLELNAGMAEKLGVEAGDKVRHPFFKAP